MKRIYAATAGRCVGGEQPERELVERAAVGRFLAPSRDGRPFEAGGGLLRDVRSGLWRSMDAGDSWERVGEDVVKDPLWRSRLAPPREAGNTASFTRGPSRARCTVGGRG
jgi:hypothetical protein